MEKKSSDPSLAIVSFCLPYPFALVLLLVHGDTTQND